MGQEERKSICEGNRVERNAFQVGVSEDGTSTIMISGKNGKKHIVSDDNKHVGR